MNRISRFLARNRISHINNLLSATLAQRNLSFEYLYGILIFLYFFLAYEAFFLAPFMPLGLFAPAFSSLTVISVPISLFVAHYTFLE
jgi:hypothetical protein